MDRCYISSKKYTLLVQQKAKLFKWFFCGKSKVVPQRTSLQQQLLSSTRISSTTCNTSPVMWSITGCTLVLCYPRRLCSVSLPWLQRLCDSRQTLLPQGSEAWPTNSHVSPAVHCSPCFSLWTRESPSCPTNGAGICH